MPLLWRAGPQVHAKLCPGSNFSLIWCCQVDETLCNLLLQFSHKFPVLTYQDQNAGRQELFEAHPLSRRPWSGQYSNSHAEDRTAGTFRVRSCGYLGQRIFCFQPLLIVITLYATTTTNLSKWSKSIFGHVLINPVTTSNYCLAKKCVVHG